MAEETKQDEPKLGPNVTYVPEDENDKRPTSVAGVQFVPGKAVNLEDRLGAGAAPILKKLSGNRFFKVDGGPDWKAEMEKRRKAEEQEAKDAEEARDEQARRELAGQGAPQPPDDWKGPEEATLEKGSAANRPPMPKPKEK